MKWMGAVVLVLFCLASGLFAAETDEEKALVETVTLLSREKKAWGLQKSKARPSGLCMKNSKTCCCRSIYAVQSP